MITDIKLSQAFKTQTTKAIFSIVLFFIVYISIIAFAVGLTVFCSYMGVQLIQTFPSFYIIIIGLSLFILGFLVLFFVLKFLFSSNKVDLSHLTEIKRQDQPKLFDLIDQIVDEVGTTSPKKVFLSPDINASVFYNSNFWSMFFPVRKNLQIGLGLVNSITAEELKAILSHEFGHFSQKTMKVGTYVYNVNQVIYNMLYDNKGYESFISNIASLGDFLALLVSVVVLIVKGIQWILQKMYGIVNKSYMGLSREMEFHADEIAAHVTGHEPLKNALLRLDFANLSFNHVINFYDAKITENFKSKNVFKEHRFVMHHLATANALPVKNELAQISLVELNKYNKSKLVIKDQWASHPSLEERITYLEGLNLSSSNSSSPLANTLFENIEKVQETMTAKMFSEVKKEEALKDISFQDFQNDFMANHEKNSFPELYNGYYDDKNPTIFDLESIDFSDSPLQLEQLFSQQKIDWVYTSASLNSDIENIKQIADKHSPIKSFDYDGIKYKKKESRKVNKKLVQNLNELNEKINNNDVQIFKYFYSIAPNEKKQILKEKYQLFFNAEKDFHEKYHHFEVISNDLSFLNHEWPMEEIQHRFAQIEIKEKELKKEIQHLLNDPLYQEELTPQIKENLELYTSQKWPYIGYSKFFEENLDILFNALNNYAYILSRGYFLLKKDLLIYQENISNSIRSYMD